MTFNSSKSFSLGVCLDANHAFLCKSFTYIYGALGTAEPEQTSTEWISTASSVAKMKFNCHTYDLKVRIDDPSKFATLLKNAENLSSFMLANLDTDRPRPQVYCCQGLSGLALKAVRKDPSTWWYPTKI